MGKTPNGVPWNSDIFDEEEDFLSRLDKEKALKNVLRCKNQENSKWEVNFQSWSQTHLGAVGKKSDLEWRKYIIALNCSETR